ncbi:MAG: hypothetical protein ACMVY4_21610 [Minwuia sp.]|uniref:hypothetical protein n=1 Tax=Minwuia sp. TaxID=2493630 RepID=UPI003A85DABC
MSIVRISALKGAIHGIWIDGAFAHEAYDRRSFHGRTEGFAEPGVPDGGFEPLRPGDRPDWRDLDRRGFPRETSDLYHLLAARFEQSAKDLDDGPVTVMVHGFLFDPRNSISSEPKETDNPHARLYHFLERPMAEEVRHHTTGWPARLGYTGADLSGREGMVLAFGWHSRPGFAESLIKGGQNFYARAYSNAEPAAWNLLTALHVLDHKLAAGKKITLFCHSLGSRVVIRLIAMAAKHNRRDLLDRIDKVIILGGAEYVVEARLMLRRLTEVGMLDRISFYNVVSRENDVLDKLGENFGPRTFGNTNVVGHNGLDVEDSRSLGDSWVDMQIDSREFADWMRANRNFKVTGDNPDAVWDHWYYFTDPGNMALYRDIIRNPDGWKIADLRQAGMPDRVSRRRSVFGD